MLCYSQGFVADDAEFLILYNHYLYKPRNLDLPYIFLVSRLFDLEDMDDDEYLAELRFKTEERHTV